MAETANSKGKHRCMLCGKRGCSDWTWDDVSVTGGSKAIVMGGSNGCGLSGAQIALVGFHFVYQGAGGFGWDLG